MKITRKVGGSKAAAPAARTRRKPAAPVEDTSGEVELGAGVRATRTRRRATTTVDNRGQLEVSGDTGANVVEATIDEYTDRALFNYGSYVVEDRAIPELRDGLKPSHRAMLWSLHVEGASFASGSVKKSAKVVGTAIGAFHPHGDTAVYGAGVTIANYSPPLIHGVGNFGSPVDGAAAMRYTEMRLSRFSSMFMMDKDYLSAVPFVENYSEDMKWPLYLPALLPVLLLGGNPTIPAYGVRAGNPAFDLYGITKLVNAGLRGRTITDADCVKYLKPKHVTGAECVSTEAELKTLIATGRGSLKYAPRMTADWKRKLIIIQSYSPVTLTGSDATVEKTLQVIAAINGVSQASDNSSAKNKDAGPYGCAIYITPSRTVSEDRFYELALEIRDRILSKSESYDLGVTVRQFGKKTIFRRMSFAEYLNNWVQYRINLEVRMLDSLLTSARADLHIVDGKLTICKSKDAIDKAIHLIRTAADPKAALMKAFKLDEVQVDAVLSMQLRSIAKLALSELQEYRAKLLSDIKGYEARKAEPGKSAATVTTTRVKQYMKKPDETVSGVPVFSEEWKL